MYIIYILIYIYTHVYIYIHIHIYMYMYICNIRISYTLFQSPCVDHAGATRQRAAGRSLPSQKRETLGPSDGHGTDGGTSH